MWLASLRNWVIYLLISSWIDMWLVVAINSESWKLKKRSLDSGSRTFHGCDSASHTFLSFLSINWRFYSILCKSFFQSQVPFTLSSLPLWLGLGGPPSLSSTVMLLNCDDGFLFYSSQWSGICGSDSVMLCTLESHKTVTKLYTVVRTPPRGNVEMLEWEWGQAWVTPLRHHRP